MPDTTTITTFTKNTVESEKKQADFCLLYDQYSSATFGYIKKILLKEDVSKEVLVTVFTYIWQNFENFNNSNCSSLCAILKIARKEANKQRINIALNQMFAIDRNQKLTITI